MEKLSFFGVGPKMGRILVPWLAISIILSIVIKEAFRYSENHRGLLIAGIILMVFGLIFYFSTIRLLLKGLKETKLVTGGAYSLCQNPLYASIILFIIPALSFLMNSWLVLTTSFAGYVLCKVYIDKEYHELEKFFGEEYLEYKKRTPEFFPLPFKKLLKQ